MELISGNIFLRPNIGMKAGETMPGHLHNFDHTTFFLSKCRVIKKVPVIKDDGTSYEQVADKTFGAGQWALIEANALHEIEVLEDGGFVCVYSHRTPQGEVSETYTGWNEAYV